MDRKTPIDIWHEAHEFVKRFDLDSFAEMFADTGTLEMPFAPVGMPKKIENKDKIKFVLGTAAAHAKKAGRQILRYEDIVVHTTTDPETIVVEFNLVGTSPTGEYSARYIQVMTVRDGFIQNFRDYIDPQVFTSERK